MIRVETSTTAHALALSLVLRPEDRREMQMLGFEPRAGLVDMIDRSVTAWTGLEHDMPFVMGGYHVPMLTGTTAYPWMWTGLRAGPLAKHILRFAKGFLDDLAMQYDRLETYVDPDYAGARRLLQRLGFREEAVAMVHGHRLIVVRRD